MSNIIHGVSYIIRNGMCQRHNSLCTIAVLLFCILSNNSSVIVYRHLILLISASKSISPIIIIGLYPVELMFGTIVFRIYVNMPIFVFDEL